MSRWTDEHQRVYEALEAGLIEPPPPPPATVWTERHAKLAHSMRVRALHREVWENLHYRHPERDDRSGWGRLIGGPR